MEYILQLEKQRRYKLLITSVVLFFIFMLFCAIFLGPKGIALSVGLLFFGILTPLFVGKYKFFFLLWLIFFPLSGIFIRTNMDFNMINPFTFLTTGLSMPYAIILFSKYINRVTKALPYLWGILILEVTILFNIVRSANGILSTIQWFNYHFMEIFLITVTYLYLKDNPPDFIFKWMSYFGIANAITAVFQGVTGIGLTNVAGMMRTAGLTPHPNTCAFFINVFLTLVLYKFIKAETRNQKLFWIIIALLNIFALVLTMSKTSFAIFGVLLLIIFFNLPQKQKFNFFIFAFLSVLAFLVFDHFLHLEIINNIQERFAETDSLKWRFKIWGWLLGNLNLLSVFIGNGLGSVYEYLSRVNPTDAPISHNGYVEIIYERGIFGFTYIFSLLYIIMNSLKKIVKESEFFNKIEFLVPFMISTVVLLECCFESVFIHKVTLYYVWILITIFFIKNNLNNDSQRIKNG